MPSWLAPALALLLVPFMISGQSFWIDELATWNLAALPTLQAFTDHLFHTTVSEGQMPLAMFISWVYLHLFGTSEWVLRSMNYPWLITAIAAAWALGRRFGAPWFALALAAHPFFWFYADEFRPYAMIIASSTMMLYPLLKAVTDPTSLTRCDALVMLVAAVVLSASSLLAMFSLGVYYAAAALIILVQRKSLRAFVRRLLWQALFLLPLAGFYISTLLRGTGGAKLWNVNLSSLVFSGYELFGFLGMGPGRIALRAAGKQGMGAILTAMQPFLIPIGCLALFYAVIAVLCLKPRTSPTPRRIRDVSAPVVGFLFTAIVSNTGLLFLAARLVGFPFWGRHLSPLLPYAVLGSGLAVAYACGPRRERWGIAVFIALLLASSLQLRFASRHAKDDYRAAADIAATAVQQGKSVWWVASELGARYYGLTTQAEIDAGKSPVIITRNPTAEEVAERALPETVILSKPDLYDQKKAVREFLKNDGYQRTETLPGFAVWGSPAEGATP